MNSTTCNRANWYKAKAADCNRIAKEAHDLQVREQFEELALQWTDLVKLAECNEGIAP